MSLSLTAEAVKQFAFDRGADLVGIASMDRFEGAPAQMDPRNIWPDARSAIVIGRRIPRGVYRGIEEGTHWPNYTFYGYNRLNVLFRPIVTYETACFIEDHGWEALPVYPGVPEAEPSHQQLRPDLPAPNVVPHIRLAAVAAGLGEIGWSKVFLSPQFGPRQRLGMILTDAELEPDPLFDGQICDRCMACVEACPGAIPHQREGKVVRITLAGRTLEWADVDMGICTATHHGMNKEVSPFLARDFPGLRLNLREQGLTEEEAYKLTYTLARATWRRTDEFPSGSVIDFYRMALGATGYFAICGARGCIRACMDHLEKTGRIGNLFHEPFRRRPRWSLPYDASPAGSGLSDDTHADPI
ncbi:MAG: hypothetical protein J7M26_02990 [Armatimonadetes bacterium]|nr:hypothetical protein [Armatimonadota bacterium]